MRHPNVYGPLSAVQAERYRQEQLVAEGKFDWACADPAVPHAGKLAVLVEEVGEVAEVLCDHHDWHLPDTSGTRRLRDELVQVAAVAVAWVEAIDAAQIERRAA